ncbi:MAG: class I SAM-dependent methyltransferase [Candidatus Woesearchaeota archaeon]
MSDKNTWDAIWESKELEEANEFARRSLSRIKDANLKTLLDLGCGDGRDSLFFASEGLTVTSVDYSENGIKKLNELSKEKGLKINPIQTDMRKIDFPDNSFDVIYAHLSLHYFDDEETTMLFENLFRILKQDGLIFIKCKSVEDPLYGQGEKVGEHMYKKGHLRHFFSEEYMKEKLRDFNILSVRKTSSEYHQYESNFIEAVATI